MESQNKICEVKCTQIKEHANKTAVAMCSNDNGYLFLCADCKSHHSENCKCNLKDLDDMKEIFQTYTQSRIVMECESKISQKKKELLVAADKQIEMQASSGKDCIFKLHDICMMESHKFDYEKAISALSQNPGVKDYFSKPNSYALIAIHSILSKNKDLPNGSAIDINFYEKNNSIDEIVEKVIYNSSEDSKVGCEINLLGKKIDANGIIKIAYELCKKPSVTSLSISF